jgi:threonyl-tRNA synthetase
MIDLVFPDGSARQYPDGSSGRDVAAAISKSLEKKALLIKLDGQVLDLDRPLTPDLLTGERKFEILTREAPEALDTIRHDTAHVLAEAVQELFPGTQVTIGPNVEDGFYYDFAREEPFSLEDLPKIEERMRQIVDRDEKIRREEVDRDAAIADFEAWARATRPRSSVTCRPATRSRSITRATSGRTCAAVRTCRRPSTSARPSS